MKKPHKRSLQVADEIKKELSSIIQNEIHDPKLGFITITGVNMTDDLKYAKVSVSVLGDNEKRNKSLKILKNAVKFIRRELASRIRLKNVPELSFELDESLDRVFRIENLINEIKKEDK